MIFQSTADWPMAYREMRPLTEANDTVIRFTIDTADSGLPAMKYNERPAKIALKTIPEIRAVNFFDSNGPLFICSYLL